MISFSSINIITKYFNPDSSNCNSNDTKNITETINRNLVKNFKLPIQYLDGSEEEYLIPTQQNVSIKFQFSRIY